MQSEGDRLRAQIAERDEIIIMLQHIIRDLRHECENLRAEKVYGAFAEDRMERIHA